MLEYSEKDIPLATLENIISNCNTSDSSNGVLNYSSNYSVDLTKVPSINSNQKDFVMFTDDNIKYREIPADTNFITSGYKLDFIGAALDKDNVYVKVKYTSPIQSYVNVFLQGDTPGLKEYFHSATKAGDNIVIFKFNKEVLKAFTAGLAINVGERNFVFIDKALMDSIANTDNQ